MGDPVAYVRKSTRGGIDSKADQIANIMAIVRPEHRASLLILDGDWGISASREKQAKRLDFMRLMEMVERGEVEHLYAYSADRLARNVGWSARLLDACKDAGILISTGERTFDPRDSSDRQMWHFAAMSNEAEVEKYQRKATDRVARSRVRGVKLGPPHYGELPGEDVAAVLQAFRDGGSAHRAAVLLNAEGSKVRPRRAASWVHGSVRQILVRQGVVPPLGTRGAKARGTFYLSRLLHCQCGRVLSGVNQAGPVRRGHTTHSVLYRCVGATADPNHRRKSVAESRVLPWVRDEVARLRPPAAVQMAEDADAKRVDIAEARRKLAVAFSRGAFDDDEAYAAEDQALADELETLDQMSRPRIVPALDWDAPVGDVNAALRAVFLHITLDADMAVASAPWAMPEWRGENVVATP